MNGKNSNNPWKAMGLMGVVGIELSLFLLGGIWLGKKIDTYFNSAPIFLIIGMVLGLLIGIWSIAVLIKEYLKD